MTRPQTRHSRERFEVRDELQDLLKRIEAQNARARRSIAEMNGLADRFTADSLHVSAEQEQFVAAFEAAEGSGE